MKITNVVNASGISTANRAYSGASRSNCKDFADYDGVCLPSIRGGGDFSLTNSAKNLGIKRDFDIGFLLSTSVYRVGLHYQQELTEPFAH